jgi:hypothetical protein
LNLLYFLAHLTPPSVLPTFKSVHSSWATSV